MSEINFLIKTVTNKDINHAVFNSFFQEIHIYLLKSVWNGTVASSYRNSSKPFLISTGLQRIYNKRSFSSSETCPQSYPIGHSCVHKHVHKTELNMKFVPLLFLQVTSVHTGLQLFIL